ncbi:MAG: hypothetical protein HZB23_07160 [Deltaproteobacteria bacterium]|nr:hypothetical protein [Deltaproteobacteria bacterium]
MQEPIAITYIFSFDDGKTEIFPLSFHAETMNLVGPLPRVAPKWAELSFHKCPHCPLSTATCPVAAALSEVLAGFDGRRSYDPVLLEVTSRERKVTAQTTLQRGLSSMMGLIMATAGCPHAAFLKPMARFHLPLAGEAETLYRATSMYLLAQYFKARDGQAPDLSLAGLEEHYGAMETVNISMSKRLRAAMATDPAVNAVIILDTYAKLLPFSISESLDVVRPAFGDYLADRGKPG